MATTNVDAAMVEIRSKVAAYAPQLEGFRGYARLNLHEDTHREVQLAIDQYVRRVGLLETASTALEALVKDGHPELDVREVAQAVYADLQENAATIEAALGQFIPNVATTLRPTAGQTELKG